MVSNSVRIAYAIQNVGNIDFRQDIGDVVPVKHTIRGLVKAGHQVSCIRLAGRSVVVCDDINRLQDCREAPLGISGTWFFRLVESGARRLQRALQAPYFAFFDSFRFYEACLHSLPGYRLCHEHNGLLSAGTAFACRRLKIPYILTFSADPLLELKLVGKPLRGLHARVAAWEARLTYRSADKIICVSEPAKSHLVEHWQVEPGKIVVMPNGVDIELFGAPCDARSARDMLGLGEAPVITFVGSFQHWHGIELLVESFALVLAEAPEAKLVLVGDGPVREAIQGKVNQLGLSGAVLFTGLMPQQRVPEILAAADVAAIPYPRLPQDLWFSPLKLYEYMAAGKAIVASRAGQIAEVIDHGQNGLLVEPGDVQAMAQSILRLIRNPSERDYLGQNARQQAVERYSWDQYVQRVIDLYLSVL
jgi:glycosyltransferase involved in cell wall biosynthesis